jgi:hypothetical protein
MAPHSKGGQKFKKKPLNTTKTNFETPKKYILCCFVAIRVPMWFDFRRHSYNTLNRLKWIRNKKVMSFKSSKGPKKEKTKQNVS